METTLTALKDAGVREQVKVMIGRADHPELCTPDRRRRLLPDASRAVAVAKSLISTD